MQKAVLLSIKYKEVYSIILIFLAYLKLLLVFLRLISCLYFYKCFEHSPKPVVSGSVFPKT